MRGANVSTVGGGEEESRGRMRGSRRRRRLQGGAGGGEPGKDERQVEGGEAYKEIGGTFCVEGGGCVLRDGFNIWGEASA